MHLESAYAGMTTHNRINNFPHNIVMIIYTVNNYIQYNARNARELLLTKTRAREHTHAPTEPTTHAHATRQPAEAAQTASEQRIDASMIVVFRCRNRHFVVRARADAVAINVEHRERLHTHTHTYANSSS